MKKHKRGFTLAEVLITLVIIGIIAAMTIPTLMNKTNEQETVVAVKKAYSTIAQAYRRVVAENGELNPSYFGTTQEECTKNFGDIFVKYLNVQKNCEQKGETECWSTTNGGVYKYLNGNDWFDWNADSNDHYRLILNDGTFLGLIAFHDYAVRGTSEQLKCVFAMLNIDINGDKGPNTLGKDVFSFFITKNDVIPCGTPYDTWKESKASACRTIGRGCTAWVITKGNMDYLRKDISW